MVEPLILNVEGRLFRFHYEERDRPLFIALGAALAEAQALEFLLAGVLGLATSSKGGDADALNDDFLSRTIGYLARRIREYAPDDETADVLDQLVEKRNYLVHRYLRKYKWPMATIDEYGNAVRELDQIRTFLRDGGDSIVLAMKRAQDLEIIMVRTNPDTGEPELIE